MYDLQHGLRVKRSCETQLIMLVEDLAGNAGFGKQTGPFKKNESKV